MESNLYLSRTSRGRLWGVRSVESKRFDNRWRVSIVSETFGPTTVIRAIMLARVGGCQSMEYRNRETYVNKRPRLLNSNRPGSTRIKTGSVLGQRNITSDDPVYIDENTQFPIKESKWR